MGCITLPRSWCVAGPDRTTSCCHTPSQFTHSWYIHAVMESSPQPSRHLGVHFCYRLREKKGMSQGHAEPGLEPKVLSPPPNSPHPASLHERPWLWPADLGFGHLLAGHTTGPSQPPGIRLQWPEVLTLCVGQSFNKYLQQLPYWSPDYHSCPF